MNSPGYLHMRLCRLITLLAFCGALTACGGGIYGTGSGTEAEISQQPPSSGMNDTASSADPTDTDNSTDPTDSDNPVAPADAGNPADPADAGNPADPADAGNPTDPGNPADPNDQPDTGENAAVPSVDDTRQTAFSNTVPSGLDLPPQLKLINLSNAPINAYMHETSIDLFDIAAPPQSTSNYSTLMLGENDITVINADTLAPIGRINPLNVARGSVTSLLIADTLSHPASLPDILPLSTRVTSAAADMTMVRLVSTAHPDSTLADTYTLMPQGTNPGMAEINFTGMNTTNQRVSDYQLAGAGDYALTDGTGRTIAGDLRFSQGMVYTLIITDPIDSGIYLEVDRAP